MNLFCNEPGSSLRVSHHTGLRRLEKDCRSRAAATTEGKNGGGSNDGGLADLEWLGDGDLERWIKSDRGRQQRRRARRSGAAWRRRSGAVDRERRRQEATTEGSPIWSGGSREAEAATMEAVMAEAATTEGSLIWSGLAMAIWSGGSRAAEAVVAEAAAEDIQRRRMYSGGGTNREE
ncbi:hypothetical protein LR48_Vigan10g110200 [Vigna angularis]|uniref:Uncharacterized protein n=1 Tax=Phaseolus angularis TaxID=3914 RepID=A0A0L9VJI5_PHAAN|nr:hypothetical protein LR48_Vigan10g110200 [Vigna angularis]